MSITVINDINFGLVHKVLVDGHEYDPSKVEYALFQVFGKNLIATRHPAKCVRRDFRIQESLFLFYGHLRKHLLLSSKKLSEF